MTVIDKLRKALIDGVSIDNVSSDNVEKKTLRI